ncbi:MAG: hypothetical protein JO102_06655, partial [Elusimicrobia bacterium]|nr:hypothetical protein [Elusimicrobiota bacterium]
LLEEAFHVLEGQPLESPLWVGDPREVVNDFMQLLFWDPDKLADFQSAYTEWTLDEKRALYHRYVVQTGLNPNTQLRQILERLRADLQVETPAFMTQPGAPAAHLLFSREALLRVTREVQAEHDPSEAALFAAAVPTMLARDGYEYLDELLVSERFSHYRPLFATWVLPNGNGGASAPAAPVAPRPEPPADSPGNPPAPGTQNVDGRRRRPDLSRLGERALEAALAVAKTGLGVNAELIVPGKSGSRFKVAFARARKEGPMPLFTPDGRALLKRETSASHPDESWLVAYRWDAAQGNVRDRKPLFPISASEPMPVFSRNRLLRREHIGVGAKIGGDWIVSYQWDPLSAEVSGRRLLFNAVGDAIPVFSPDGKQALVREDILGETWIVAHSVADDGTLGAATPLFKTTVEAPMPVFSPDGSQLLVLDTSSADERVLIYSRKTDGSLGPSRIFGRAIDRRLPVFSADGKTVIARETPSEVGVFVRTPDGEVGERAMDIDSPDDRPMPVVSPDGGHIVTIEELQAQQYWFVSRAAAPTKMYSGAPLHEMAHDLFFGRGSRPTAFTGAVSLAVAVAVLAGAANPSNAFVQTAAWIVFGAGVIAALAYRFFSSRAATARARQTGVDATEVRDALARLNGAEAATLSDVLKAVGDRETLPDGTDALLNNLADAIRPAGASTRERLGLAASLAVFIRRAIRAGARTFADALGAALSANPQAPVVVFVNDDKPETLEQVRKTFEEVDRRNRTLAGRLNAWLGGQPSFVLLVVAPEIGENAALIQSLDEVQRAHSATVASAIRVAGRDFAPRDGAFRYEDMFRAFAASFTDGRIRELLIRLGDDDPEAGLRVVQVNSPAQPYTAAERLLALIVLLAPVERGTILIDLGAALAAAKSA